MGWFSASGKDDEDLKRNLREKVAKEQGVDADEIVMKDNGDVMLDRRARFPRAEPMKIGDWKKR